MAFAASGAFGLNLKDIFDNVVAMDWPTDTQKAALFSNSISTPNYDTETAYGSGSFPTTPNQITGTGYTIGGVALASPTLSISPTKVLMFDCNDPSWTSATFSGVRGVLYYDTSVSNKGWFAVTFGADFAVTAGTFTIVENAAGVATLTYA